MSRAPAKWANLVRKPRVQRRTPKPNELTSFQKSLLRMVLAIRRLNDDELNITALTELLANVFPPRGSASYSREEKLDIRDWCAHFDYKDWTR